MSAPRLTAAPFFYGDESQRLDAARSLARRFEEFVVTDPDRARTQLIAGIQVALRDAYAQGARAVLISIAKETLNAND